MFRGTRVLADEGKYLFGGILTCYSGKQRSRPNHADAPSESTPSGMAAASFPMQKYFWPQIDGLKFTVVGAYRKWKSIRWIWGFIYNSTEFPFSCHEQLNMIRSGTYVAPCLFLETGKGEALSTNFEHSDPCKLLSSHSKYRLFHLLRKTSMKWQFIVL